ncbi:Hypothetical predicted protein, partial [Paramuricea clavata]
MDEHKELFIWKKEHGQYFVRELLVTEQYMFKPKSIERGEAWRWLMENLNKLEKPKFRVTVRFVRDWFTKMVEKYKKLENEKARVTGITGAEFDEVYQGMVDIFDSMDEAKINWDNESDLEKEKQNLEKSKAEHMSLCQEGLKMKKENFKTEIELSEAELEDRKLARQSQ